MTCLHGVVLNVQSLVSVWVAQIDENVVRNSSGTTLGYPLHQLTLPVVTCADPRVEGINFWEAFGVTLLTYWSRVFLLVFFRAFLSCLFGFFAVLRVPKVGNKGAKMEPKAIPE